VIKACNNIDAEILVIDNNSTDGSKEFFSGRFPEVTFMWQEQNTGFAKANNEALKLVKGKKILFLNPDTILPEDCLEKCLQFFDQQNNIGALGVKMIDGSGNFLPESKRGFPSAFTSFCKMTGLTSLFPQSTIFARYYLGHLPEDKTNAVDVLSGAFMMIDKIVLATVGSFDEDYFMYAEDIDLSYRIQKAGYTNFYFADTCIIHFKGESTVKQSAAYIRNFYGTMILFVQKHYSGVSKTLYVLLLKLLMVVKRFFSGNKKQDHNKKITSKAFVLIDEISYGRIAAGLQKYFTQSKRIDSFVVAEEGNVIIFCVPSVSLSSAIAFMQQYKNKHGVFIHANGTCSVVGSSDKNYPGIAIALTVPPKN
jgi:GT2 family glycosyltransferase